MLIGFDLLKPVPLLLAAYDDPQGVTRAFNLNLLLRMNRELGAGVEVDAFRHLATFDPARPAMESWLEVMRPQKIRLAGLEFRLEAGERIHTEISRSTPMRRFSWLAERSGFAEVVRYRDARGYFADALWRVE